MGYEKKHTMRGRHGHKTSNNEQREWGQKAGKTYCEQSHQDALLKNVNKACHG